MIKNLVLYHKNCADGLGAALALDIYFWENGQEADFQTVQYGDPPPDVSGKNVYIVDFSFPRNDLMRMHSQAESLIVIDHHQTAEAELKDLPYCIFDNSKSGAVLTWEYLFPDTPVPLLFQYLQDRDLWKWELPESREVSAALRSYPPFLSVWKEFMSVAGVERLKNEGGAILRYQKREIDSVISRPKEMVNIAGYMVPCVNCTHLISEIGNELAQGHPFVALYFDTSDGKRVFSLRSAEDGVDVSAVAKQFGGGGHYHAAGFTVERPKLI